MQWESRIRGRRDGGERTGLAGDNTDINRQQKQRDRGRESAVKKGTGVQKHRARETAEAGTQRDQREGGISFRVKKGRGGSRSRCTTVGRSGERQRKKSTRQGRAGVRDII